MVAICALYYQTAASRGKEGRGYTTRKPLWHSLSRYQQFTRVVMDSSISRTHLSDSRQKPNVQPVTLAPLDAAGEALFQETYNISADHVRRVFSTP